MGGSSEPCGTDGSEAGKLAEHYSELRGTIVVCQTTLKKQTVFIFFRCPKAWHHLAKLKMLIFQLVFDVFEAKWRFSI